MVRLMVYISRFLSQFTRTLVITLYEKSAGKGARHAWTSKATSIGALSHIAVQCYEHIQSRQLPYRFRSMECVATRTQRFSLLPSLAFLCMVPPSAIEHVPSSDIIKIRPGPFSDIFRVMLSEQDAVLASARVLLGSASRCRRATDAAIEEVEE
jgi:hypothetical protein